MNDKELLMNVYSIFGKEGFKRLAQILNSKCVRDIDLKGNDCEGNPIDIDINYCIECTIQSVEEEFLRRSIKQQLSANMLMIVNIVDFNPNVRIAPEHLNIKVEEYYTLMEDMNEMNERDLDHLKKLVREDYEYLSSLDI